MNGLTVMKKAVEIFDKIKLSNNIDYVGVWYFKAYDLIKYTNIKVIVISTNSTNQEEQVAPLCETLFERYNINIK